MGGDDKNLERKGIVVKFPSPIGSGMGGGEPVSRAVGFADWAFKVETPSPRNCNQQNPEYDLKKYEKERD